MNAVTIQGFFLEHLVLEHLNRVLMGDSIIFQPVHFALVVP